MSRPPRYPSQHRSFDIDDIPSDREDGSSSWVHKALVWTGRLGRVPAAFLLPLWIALMLVAAWPWRDLRVAAGAGFALFFVADGLMLALLPVTRRSWGPVTPPLTGLALVRCLLFCAVGWLASTPLALSALTLLNLALSGIATYATWLEPFQIRWTAQDFGVPAWTSGDPVCALHLSDLHFERASLREARLLELIQDNPADLLLLTGDYMNLSSVYDPEAQQGVSNLLAQLAPYFPGGVYAITGSPVVDRADVVPAIFEQLPIRWLIDEGALVEIEGHALWLMGVHCTYHLDRDAQALERLLQAAPDGVPRFLLYHTPDLMPHAAALGVDLYLCGHTHGGQICMPGYGAITTGSRWGKRYEQGRYRKNQTTLYISRGLGLEGLGAPRARFLAPPEVIEWQFRASL